MANLRVLIADEDGQERTLAQRVLTQQGYFVVPASDGGEALTQMQNGSLDVIVAAVTLPKHDGLEILRAAQERARPLPVILLADAANIAPAATGVRAGAFDYLVKPIQDMTQLALLIDRAAGQAPMPRPIPTGAPPVTLLAPPPVETQTSLAASIAQNQDLNVLLNQYAIELARATRATHTFVLLPHNDGQLHLTASHGFTARIEAGRTYNALSGEKFALRIAAAKSVQWLQRGADDSPQNTLGIPLLFQDRIMGIAIAHETAPPETISPALLASVQELTQQAAIGIELARLSARVKRLEPLDPVTGLFSREHFFELADRDFRRAWRFDQTMCAIVMDVDDFGNLHLTLGPHETDQAMRRVASTVRDHVRKVDVVGRLNPHTIGFSLWMAKKEHGLAVAERLRLLVAEIQVPTADETWQVTASFGVAAYRNSISSVFDLFGIADQALRAAKRAGHNRVEGV
ncbi:MAG: diguanylate cyclase [Chloroflexi bacterium]|nr:diguanylate cyclase [Chloroflexota bacterium]